MRKLNPNTIIKLTRFFYSKIIPYLPKFSNRGRPKIYPDHQIISMLLIREMFSLPFRETIILSRDYFKKVPSLRDFHYRARKLKHVIQILIKFIHDYDVESIREIVDKGIKKAVKKVIMENGEPARYIKIAVLGNGKVFTISTTDETGSMVFIVPGKNYSFSILTEGYKLVSSNSVLVVSCPSQNSFLWGPYITDPTTNSAYLNFKLSKPSTASIILTDGNGNTQKLESRFLDTFHSINLENLSPNEKYSVLVKVDGIEERCGFKTLGSRSFKFVIYGDTRTNEDWHEMVCKEIAKEKPLFVINVGDLVENGESLEDWNKFFKAFKSLSAVSPYFPVLGNHEKNSNIYYQAFMLPKGGGDFQRGWYSFDAGDVRFIVLDSNVPKGTSLFEKQTKWLIEGLERNRDKKFKFVFFYHPFYTNTPNEEPTYEESWRWIFEKYKEIQSRCGFLRSHPRLRKIFEERCNLCGYRWWRCPPWVLVFILQIENIFLAL